MRSGRMWGPFPMDAYLEFGMAFVDKDVGSLELRDVAVALELLPHLGADGRNRHVQGVHGLDLGCLDVMRLASARLSCYSTSDMLNSSALSRSFAPRSPQGIRTARSQSRYELSTRFDASSQFAARRGVSVQWLSLADGGFLPYIGAFAAQGMWG